MYILGLLGEHIKHRMNINQQWPEGAVMEGVKEAIDLTCTTFTYVFI